MQPTKSAILKQALQVHHTEPLRARIVSSIIVQALFPQNLSSGAMFYSLKAQNWLTLLLEAEPDMSLETLSLRVCALAQVSPAVQGELGGLAARLSQLDFTEKT
jgi:hypothetical protein